MTKISLIQSNAIFVFVIVDEETLMWLWHDVIDRWLMTWCLPLAASMVWRQSSTSSAMIHRPTNGNINKSPLYGIREPPVRHVQISTWITLCELFSGGSRAPGFRIIIHADFILINVITGKHPKSEISLHRRCQVWSQRPIPICVDGDKRLTNREVKILLADRTKGRAYATVLRPSVVCLWCYVLWLNGAP